MYFAANTRQHEAILGGSEANNSNNNTTLNISSSDDVAYDVEMGNKAMALYAKGDFQ